MTNNLSMHKEIHFKYIIDIFSVYNSQEDIQKS